MYNAVGLAAEDLFDYVNADHWFLTQVICSAFESIIWLNFALSFFRSSYARARACVRARAWVCLQVLPKLNGDFDNLLRRRALWLTQKWIPVRINSIESEREREKKKRKKERE